MALRPPAKPLNPADEAAIQQVISGGSDTLADRQGREGKKPPPAESRDIAFTMTIPPGLAVLIDRHRAPTKTSRRAWLLQAAEEKLKREGLV
ncbi:MAG: hypothetical protein H7Y60_05015 [Rhodospirillaceae bacterium]|nr:hypothetical protein [Rhodospirillales bacterium]